MRPPLHPPPPFPFPHTTPHHACAQVVRGGNPGGRSLSCRGTGLVVQGRPPRPNPSVVGPSPSAFRLRLASAGPERAACLGSGGRAGGRAGGVGTGLCLSFVDFPAAFKQRTFADGDRTLRGRCGDGEIRTRTSGLFSHSTLPRTPLAVYIVQFPECEICRRGALMSERLGAKLTGVVPHAACHFGEARAAASSHHCGARRENHTNKHDTMAF